MYHQRDLPIRAVHLHCPICVSRRYRSRSVKKPSAEFSSPYPVEDFRGPWSTTQGITPIPRASTNWASTPMEMTEGGSTHTLVDMKPHTNGAVSHL